MVLPGISCKIRRILYYETFSGNDGMRIKRSTYDRQLQPGFGGRSEGSFCKTAEQETQMSKKDES